MLIYDLNHTYHCGNNGEGIMVLMTRFLDDCWWCWEPVVWPLEVFALRALSNKLAHTVVFATDVSKIQNALPSIKFTHSATHPWNCQAVWTRDSPRCKLNSQQRIGRRVAPTSSQKCSPHKLNVSSRNSRLIHDRVCNKILAGEGQHHAKLHRH